MEAINKKLGYLNIIISFLIIVFFNEKLFLPADGIISRQSELKKYAEERTLLLEWESASWSGIILSSSLDKIKILTIIHEDSMKKILSSNKKIIFASNDKLEKKEAIIKKWNVCNELAILEITSAKNLLFFKEPKLEEKNERLSQPLFSFGHPLGLNLHYSEGYLSSVGNKIKPCGMITNGFSGGTIPGQTGSGVWNNSGELSGLIVATSAFPIRSMNKDGEVVGISNIPITFLGRFVPSYEINKFIKD